MEYIVKEEPVVLQHVPGKGAWTYHIIIPNSQEIRWKRWDMRVAWTIDGYPLINRQLAPLKNQDKMLSINQTVRKAINKQWGDIVIITLYLLPPTDETDKKEFKHYNLYK